MEKERHAADDHKTLPDLVTNITQNILLGSH